MKTFTIQVTQTYRATRTVDIEVRAPDAENALEDVKSGSVDLPPFNHPAWRTGWELTEEEYKT